MRLVESHLLLPLLLLCSNCLAAAKGKIEPGKHDGTKETIIPVGAMENTPNVYLEGPRGNTKTNSPLADFPCPVAAAISPCVCIADSESYRLDLDCTEVESRDQLEQAFQQEFPVKELYQFSMANNSAVRMLDNFMNGITCESLYLFPGPFALEMITDYFLLDLKDTVKEIRIQDSKLITETFPFLILPLMNQLTTLSIDGSDIDRIPLIRAPNLFDFRVENSAVETLVNGTISVGIGPMSVVLAYNQISTLEPGSIFFADKESADSSEQISIRLYNNQIQSLQAGTFHLRNGPSTVELFNNLITSIEPGTFVLPVATGNASSQELYIDLAPNQLQSLQAGTFPLRNGVVSLFLYSNKIASIEPGTFVLPEATDSMEIDLDLGNNMLTIVDEAVFGDMMPFMRYLGIYGNPLTCGCDIAWLVENADYMALVDVFVRCADGTLLQDLNSTSWACVQYTGLLQMASVHKNYWTGVWP